MSPIVIPTTGSPPVTTASSNGNVVGVRYAYQVAPWDSPLSLGVHALIEYNGYIINDRYQSDRIRVKNITGLDEADSTDSREAVPGDHGEFVYDSWYRGRTFVMTGTIEGGSLGTLRRLERDLKAAFSPLVESPMKFRWFDVYDSFDDPLTIQNYTPVFGSTSSLTVSGGLLLWGTTTPTLLLRSADNRLWGDVQVTVRVVVGSATDSSTVYVVPSCKDTSDYVQVVWNSGSHLLQINAVIGGVSHQLASTAAAGIQQGQSIWLRGRREGDLITAEVWTTPPADTSFPTYSTTAWLTGSDADLLGDQFLSQVGFGASTAGTHFAFDDFKVESLCPSDVSFLAKKMPNGMSIKDSQDSLTRFSRNFQITMRASRSFARCATQSRSLSLAPSASNPAQVGFISPFNSPIETRGFLPGSVQLQNNLLFINNRGTSFERPIIYLYGAIQNLTMVNLTNGMQINWNGSLADGDYLVFDCEKRTLVNSAGANMMAFFSANTSRWMFLEPGWNDIYVAGTNYSGNTRVMLFYRSQYA